MLDPFSRIFRHSPLDAPAPQPSPCIGKLARDLEHRFLFSMTLSASASLKLFFFMLSYRFAD